MNPHIEEIHKELAESAPLLASLPRKYDAHVPTGYFDHVEHQILAQMSFANILSKNQEEVPANYFDTLEAQTFQRLEKTEEAKVVQLTTNKNNHLRKLIAVAASLVLVVCCVYFLTPSLPQTNTETASTEEDVYIEYLSENIEEFDINTLIENDLVEETDLDGLSFLDEEIDLEDIEVTESQINL